MSSDRPQESRVSRTISRDAHNACAVEKGGTVLKPIALYVVEETKASTVEVGAAMYDFTGSASDELSFNKGDKIEITEVISDDWLRGKLGGCEGMFPRTFVQLSKESGME